MAGVHVRIPDGQLSCQQGVLLKEVVGKVVAGKVAWGKRGQAKQVGGEEQRGQCAVRPDYGKS